MHVVCVEMAGCALCGTVDRKRRKEIKAGEIRSRFKIDTVPPLP